jgi:pre-mRNA-splicing factor 38A
MTTQQQQQQQHHKASAAHLLDDRGYAGRLIHGANPALLFEKAVRERIVDDMYFQDQCFGLNEASLCDRAVRLTSLGGTYGSVGRPTPFLCLAFKMCQMVPGKEVVETYLNWRGEDEDEDEEGQKEDGGEGSEEKKEKDGEFKYLRALAAFYIRLAWEPVQVYKALEPLLKDYRKLKRRMRDGYVLTYMDQFVDDLLTKERVCATSLQKLPKRETLEDLDLLEPMEELDLDDIDPEEVNGNSEGSEDSYFSDRDQSEQDKDD